MRKKKQESGPIGHAQKEASKTSPSVAPVKKTIVKATRLVDRSVYKQPKRCIDAELPPQVDSVSPLEGGGTRDSGTERSPTPLENDLLHYLTLHITPPQSIGTTDCPIKHDDSWFITSFDIGVTEYLQGIVRLVQSDCPEAVHDLRPFLSAMKQAFIDVKALDNRST